MKGLGSDVSFTQSASAVSAGRDLASLHGVCKGSSSSLDDSLDESLESLLDSLFECVCSLEVCFSPNGARSRTRRRCCTARFTSRCLSARKCLTFSCAWTTCCRSSVCRSFTDFRLVTTAPALALAFAPALAPALGPGLAPATAPADLRVRVCVEDM